LSHDPSNGEALNLLGVIAMQTGRPAEAAGLIGRAVQVDSSRADFHYNLGMAYIGLRSRNQAIRCFRQATSLRPDYADALINLGNLLLNAGELDEAEACYRNAAKLVPANPMIHNNLGTVLMAKEAAAEAAPYFQRALKLKPDYAEAHNGLGSALYMRGRFDEALGSFQEALRCNPGYAEACYNLGNVCFDQDRLEDAEKYLRKAIDLKPDYNKARFRLARVLIQLDNFEPALEIYEGFLASDPESEKAWAGKANVLDRMGRTPDAYDIVRDFAMEGPPPLGMVHLYANLASKEHRQAEVAAEIEGMLAQSGQSDEDGRMLRFTLGKLYDELGRFDEAFAHYEAGNRLRPAPFDTAETQGLMDRIIEFFSAERFAGLPRADNRSDLPVFIVGMPRSGTSLVEQILSCHRDVHAAGELRDVGRLAGSLGLGFQKEGDGADSRPSLDSESLNAAASRHLECLRSQGGNAKRLTDKMPYNFLHLGLIALLFPRGRVIHCVRDPIDTCLSCYFQNFATRNFFSFDLGHAGVYYRQYERLMAHWKKVLDRPILAVRYEEHVAEPERVCREMLDFLELDWDPACLRFHESRRFTKTASRDQVRKPIYSSSSGRWQNYERHLEPLMEALCEPDRRGSV
jgi:tetratricopeptide (TPR) repeat protein